MHYDTCIDNKTAGPPDNSAAEYGGERRDALIRKGMSEWLDSDLLDRSFCPATRSWRLPAGVVRSSATRIPTTACRYSEFLDPDRSYGACVLANCVPGGTSVRLLGCALVIIAAAGLQACAGVAPPATLRGTGDLGIVIERAAGRVTVVNTTRRAALGRVSGLGDLSHAHAVYSRDGRYAYVFGRDGGLTKVDLLTLSIAGRVVQAGNSIGGSISQDGRLVVAQNYEPGGIKVFDAGTLELLADVPSTYGSEGKRSKVVGLGGYSRQQVRLCLVRRR